MLETKCSQAYKKRMVAEVQACDQFAATGLTLEITLEIMNKTEFWHEQASGKWGTSSGIGFSLPEFASAPP